MDKAEEKVEAKQMCLGCNENPATTSDGTVPLCTKCASLAKEGRRGVKYDPPAEP
jgi:hypothetical protein